MAAREDALATLGGRLRPLTAPLRRAADAAGKSRPERSTKDTSMNTTTDAPREPVHARKVTDAKERLNCLPRHFGRHQLIVEDAVYAFMRHLCAEYDGGFWHYFELSNGGFYMAPDGEPMEILVPGNGFSGEMSAEA